MEVMVVGRRAEERWRIAGALGSAAGSAAAPDLATSRLSHPASRPPDAVVLAVHDETDLAWLRWHTDRSARGWVPVITVLEQPHLCRAATAAGSAATIDRGLAADELAARLDAVLAEVTSPAAVVALRTSERTG